MYRLLLETLLGVQREGDHLRLVPLLPAAWPGFTVHYRYYRTTYQIIISRVTPGETQGLVLDGVILAGPTVPLLDDQQPHRIELRLA